MTRIVHICHQGDWEIAKEEGAYRGDTLDSQGFIHCSKPEQVLGVANAYYQENPEMLLLWIDPDRLDAELRWEEAEGENFPHIYGELNLDAVSAQTMLVADSDGVFRQFSRPD